jgi:hypothetical protein
MGDLPMVARVQVAGQRPEIAVLPRRSYHIWIRIDLSYNE